MNPHFFSAPFPVFVKSSFHPEGTYRAYVNKATLSTWHETST
jgi:hypothetical protein